MAILPSLADAPLMKALGRVSLSVCWGLMQHNKPSGRVEGDSTWNAFGFEGEGCVRVISCDCVNDTVVPMSACQNASRSQRRDGF